MTDGELLQRLSRTLKQDIGPAIDDEYPKTQAFMAAVVTEKLGRQIALAHVHRQAERLDIAALLSDLSDLLNAGTDPAILTDALASLVENPEKVGLCRLIEALYASRSELGKARFGSLLDRVRITLRAEIDRQMEYAA